MKEKENYIPELQINEPIPFFGNHFQSLIKVLADRKNDLHRQQGVLPNAEYEVIISGIMYYYQIIMSESGLPDEQKKNLCAKLVESINKALYVFLDEMDNKNSVLIQEYLTAYREYLQKIENNFREEKREQGIDVPGLIFSFSLELLGNKVHIDTLFATIYEAKVFPPEIKLCSVFAPSDIEIKNVFYYLPMLTHEISHNFKYSDTTDRNQFVINYILKEISKIIVQQMFFAASDFRYIPFIGKVEGVLAEALVEVFYEELIIYDPDYMTNGHLDSLPSLVYSVICASAPLEESLEVYYNNEPVYEILQDAYITLAKFSNLSWYVADKEGEINKTDEELIASYLLDLFSGKDIKELKHFYEKVLLHSEENQMLLRGLLNNCDSDCVKVDIKAIDIAIDEVLLSVIEKLSDDFRKSENCFVGNPVLIDDVLLSLIEENLKFQSSMDALIAALGDGCYQKLYDFCDRCSAVKDCVNNIFNISMLKEKYITKRKKGNRVITKIYRRFQATVKISMKDRKLKPYFVTRNMNSVLIKLGLFNGEEAEELFSKQYIAALNNLGKRRVYHVIEDFLGVYREIFADLSMCAVFKFNQLGYLRYMTEQFKNVREMGDFYAKDMALERIHTVLKVLEEQYGKKWLVDLYYREGDLGVTWTDEWNFIVESYLDGDRKSEYDNRYKVVYYKKILPLKWVLYLQQDEVVQMIGRYYNENNVLEAEKEGCCNKFLDYYTKTFQTKEDSYKKIGGKAINILLGGII